MPVKIQPLVEESVWSVKYKSTWSNSGAFPPNFQISVMKLRGTDNGGVLAWDNFAVVPETSHQYTIVVDQTGEQPAYRAPTSIHTTRYHKNLSMATRHLALYSGNSLMRKNSPYLDNFWRQFSNVPGQSAPEVDKRIIDQDLHDGLSGWGGDRETSPYVDLIPPWIIFPDTFYDPALYPNLFPLDVGRAPYRSHAASEVGNFSYREGVWSASPQMRVHVALQQLWGLAGPRAAWQWLSTIIWDGVGIRHTGYPGRIGGLILDGYKGNWLAVWLCCVTVLEAYLTRNGDPDGRLPDVRRWVDQVVQSVLMAQVPASGVFQDHELGPMCRPVHAGGIFNAYNTFDSQQHELMNWRPGFVYASIEWTGEQMGFWSHNPLESPQHYALPTSYEPTFWSMVGLTYHLRNRFDE